MFEGKVILFNSNGIYHLGRCVKHLSFREIIVKEVIILVPQQNGMGVAETPFEDCKEILFNVSAIAAAPDNLVNMYEEVRKKINAAKAGIVVTSKIPENNKKNKRIMNLIKNN